MSLFHGVPSDWQPAELSIVLTLVGFFSIAVAIFTAICIWPAKNVYRRLIGMLADSAGGTWYMWVAGEYGFSMIGLYLFITFGNGFRYGRRYLFGCQALCLAGCASALWVVPYWEDHRPAGIGMLIALVVLPLYVSTLLKRIQAERARAEEANRAKTTFLANMSHEMRTPLNGIVGVVDLFRTTPLSEQQSELVRLLRHSITVLRSLVDDVLDISKIEAGRLTIEVAPFDLHVCVNGLIQLLRPHAQAKGLILRASIDPALEYKLRGDSHHFRQILLNLLSNAIKFTERGEVVLSISLAKESTEGVTARFEVKDTGIGISAEALPHIFERFVQADQSTTRKYGGTGLGTTIAKQLVELMGGNIGVTSVVGEGSVFWFEVPLLRDGEVTRPAEPVHDPDEVSLLVADFEHVDKIGRVLAAAGERYEVVPAASSFSAKLELVRQSGKSIRSVVAACSVDVACVAFTTALERLDDRPVALLYVSPAEISVVDSARLKSIKDVCVFQSAVTPRLVSNAIHAAMAAGGREGAEVLDLNQVLHQQRRKLRILVAEDNATNQAIISQLLTNAGHTVLLASDGEQALDIYEQQAPDIAILDFNMPQRTGIEAIQAIRVMEASDAHMPAMILSASVTLEARERASKAGADDFISKPFDAATLIQKVDELGKRVKRPIVQTAAPSALVTYIAHARAARHVSPAIGQSDIVDPARLAELEDIARDSSFMAELLRGFKGDVEGILAKVDACLAKGDAASVPDLMHTLNGAAVGVGARHLANRCAEMDRAAFEGGSITLAQRARDLRACFNETVTYLADYVKRQHQVLL